MYQTLTFGSGSQADVLIKDPYVSPLHCTVTKYEVGGMDFFLVDDLGSTNGTWIIKPSGHTFQVRPPTTATLFEGDQVKIGRTVLPWRG